MPGRNEREAFNAYADPLRSVLACITSVQLRTEGSFKSSNPQFVFVHNPATLSGGFHLFFRQSYHLIRQDDGVWKVTTDSYEYAIDNNGRELIAFHWDPKGKVKIPHLHFGAPDQQQLLIDRKAHVPTGRVPIEDVVWFAIEELGVKPLCDDWSDIINAARERFMTFKTW